MTERYMPDDMPVTVNTKALLTLFIVDTSGSMTADNRIGEVNKAFDHIVSELKKKQIEVGDSFSIYISILEFNQFPKWICYPTPIDQYTHKAIPCSDLVTYFGRAIREVHKELRSGGKLLCNFKGKIATPYIMFMTDGHPSSGDDFDSAMDEILQNGWFISAERYAVLIGREAVGNPESHRAVSRFVKDQKEGIINATDAEELSRNISGSTLHVLNNMTKHGAATDLPVDSGSGQYQTGSQPAVPSWDPGPGLSAGAGQVPDFNATKNDDPFKNMFPGDFS